MKDKFSFFKRCIFIEIFVIISLIIAICIFNPIYNAKHLIIPYAIHPFDICIEHPIWWKNLKIIYIVTYILANIIISNAIYSTIKNKKIKKRKKQEETITSVETSQLLIYVGKNEQQQLVYIPESGLYQNILVTRNNRKRKNKFLHVSIYKTINTISKPK